MQAAQITRPDNTTVQLSSPRLYNGRQVLDYTDTHEPGIYQVRFAPTEVSAPLTGLAAGERGALAKIVEAARLMDTLYLRQVWSGNEPLFEL